MTVPFANQFEDWTDDELRADGVFARRVIRDGELNGVELDELTEHKWREWLSDIAAEIKARETRT